MTRKPFIGITLTARILISMLCMVFVVGLTYCLALFYGIHLAEDTLIGQKMKERIELAITLKDVEKVKSSEFSIIFTTKPNEVHGFQSVPEEYLQFEEGFHEVVNEGEDYFLYKYKDPKTDAVWVMLQDQGGFESKEIELFIQAGIGLAAALLLTLLLGLWLSRAVTAPVKMLAREVREMAHRTEFIPLSVRPAKDEIGELALTLENTLRDFDKALQRERAFNADVSHEFRTPLMVISSAVEVLNLKNLTPEQRQNALNRIDEASKRLNRLIRVFMELARGERLANKEKASWLSVIDQALKIWEAPAKEKGLKLQFENHSTKEPMTNAAFALSVIDNLVRNAIQYTPEGSVTIELNDKSVRVIDTGVGITDSEKEKILERFVRGKHTQGEGYGLGLSLVSRICEHEGWHLSFEKNSPKGTVFTVEFN